MRARLLCLPSLSGTAVQKPLAENGGFIDCGADDYAGAQPDFGSPRGVSQGGPHRKPARKHARAKAQFLAVALELAGCEPGVVPARR